MYVKKTICFIGIVLMIIILVVFGIIFKNKQFSITNNKDTCIEEQDVIESENMIETSQDEINHVEEVKEDLLEEQEMFETSKSIISTPTTLEKGDNPTITQYDNSNDTYSKDISTDTTGNDTDGIKVDTKQNESNVQNQETIRQDTPKNIKSYVRNTTMENTMKEYIKNNPSENMKQYGFSIELDSSIVNDTNEFTYTEKRIDGKIKYKFGTIRIYAQDVLLDGVYQFTECFIL